MSELRRLSSRAFTLHGSPALYRQRARGLLRVANSLIYSGFGHGMGDFRLGDVIDDHCIKCRRVTNHSIVSLINGDAAKVRCRTCYHDHDYRHEQAPPTKKELLKQAEAAAAAEAAKAAAATDPTEL